MHLIIMGAPGSGKGTCAVDLKAIYGIPHISTGEMFRKEISSCSPLGILAKSFIDKGQLVPDEVTNDIVKERIIQEDCKNGFLLDGYPRTLVQAIQFDKTLKELNINLDAAINLEVEDDVIVRRLCNRRTCPNCGTGYNILTMKPKVENLCDTCNIPLTKRQDDNEETIKSRLSVYYKQTKPLVEYYEKQNKVISIDGDRDVNSVVNSIVEALEAKC